MAAGVSLPASAQDTEHSTRQAKLEALEKLNAALQNEQGLSDEFKAAFSELIDSLEAEERQASATMTQEDRARLREEVLQDIEAEEIEDDKVFEAIKNVYNKIDVYGNLRLRHESDWNVDHRSERNRQRVRLRLGAKYWINDEWEIGGRVTTGNSDDTNSPYQTFGSEFDSFEISLDRVYVTYHPSWFPEMWVTAGKFQHPFKTNPVYAEVVWDADIQPEGVAAGVSLDLSESGIVDRLDFVVGQYIVTEQSQLDEASAFVTQISAEKKLLDALDLMAAFGWYRYTDLTPDDSPFMIADNQGNFVALGDFVSRFSILNPIVALTYTGLPAPLTFSGEFIHNTRARRGSPDGWAVGAAYGQTRKQDDWKLYYQFQDIGRESVLSAVAQDDFTLATNYYGQVFGAKYMLRDNIELHSWFLLAERQESSSFFVDDSGDDQWRFRVDLTIKF